MFQKNGKMKTLSLSVITICLLLSCTPEPKPIQYGTDKCDFCKMTVVDPRFGAEAVTEKGKVYMFDAIECLVNYVHQQPDKEFSYLLVNDFENPGVLIDARGCSYLISKKVPSPMGAYLSAYQNLARAKSMQEIGGGETFDWEELLDHFRNEISFSR